MTLEQLLDLIHAVRMMNDNIKEVKFEMWDGGNMRIAIRGSEYDGSGIDYFNPVNVEELSEILSQMLSL